MHDALSQSDPAVVLIATGDEWLARSIESILGPNHISLARSLAAKHALQFARTRQPDAILIQTRLPDMSGFDLCRALREEPANGVHTPILITSAGPSSRRERLDALRAGAWDFCEITPDTDELVLRIQTYVRAKRAIDQIRKSSLQDDLTGLYNLNGLMRRLQEVSSEALRYRRPLACLAIAPTVPRELVFFDARTQTEHMARVVTASCRTSDAIARLPSNEFIVIAPDTGPLGAQRLAERMLRAADDVNETVQPPDKIDVRIGFFAVPDFTAAAIRPIDMVVRATTALQRIPERATANRICAFDGQEVALS
jgi:PleD family two-component response regulator